MFNLFNVLQVVCITSNVYIVNFNIHFVSILLSFTVRREFFYISLRLTLTLLGIFYIVLNHMDLKLSYTTVE